MTTQTQVDRSGAQLPFRRSGRGGKRMQASTGRIHVPGERIGKLKKGTPKKKLIDKNSGKPRMRNGKPILIQGDDLETHFRFAPGDKESSYTDHGGRGNSGLSLADIFENVYGDKPNHLSVRVLGFDHLTKYDLSTIRDQDLAREQLQRWGVAYVCNASGSLLAETDITGEWLTQERSQSGYMESYRMHEKPTEVHRNEKDHPNYNEKVREGLECYLYDGKLLPWSYSGTLYLTMTDFCRRAGTFGNIVFETTSKIDIDQIVDELMGILMKVGGRVPLSNIPLILYRRESEISAVGFGKGHIDAARRKRVKRSNWGVHIRMDDAFVAKAFELQSKAESDHIAALLAAPRRETPEEIDTMLIASGEIETKPTEPLIIPDKNEWHSSSRSLDDDEDMDPYADDDDIEDMEISDGDFDEIGDEPEAAERTWRDGIAGAEMPKDSFTKHCVELFGISDAEAAKRFGALGITKAKVRSKRNRVLHFVRMGLYHDNCEGTTDLESLLALVNDGAEAEIKDMEMAAGLEKAGAL